MCQGPVLFMRHFLCFILVGVHGESVRFFFPSAGCVLGAMCETTRHLVCVCVYIYIYYKALLNAVERSVHGPSRLPAVNHFVTAKNIMTAVKESRFFASDLHLWITPQEDR